MHPQEEDQATGADTGEGITARQEEDGVQRAVRGRRRGGRGPRITNELEIQERKRRKENEKREMEEHQRRAVAYNEYRMQEWEIEELQRREYQRAAAYNGFWVPERGSEMEEQQRREFAAAAAAYNGLWIQERRWEMEEQQRRQSAAAAAAALFQTPPPSSLSPTQYHLSQQPPIVLLPNDNRSQQPPTVLRSNNNRSQQPPTVLRSNTYLPQQPPTVLPSYNNLPHQPPTVLPSNNNLPHQPPTVLPSSNNLSSAPRILLRARPSFFSRTMRHESNHPCPSSNQSTQQYQQPSSSNMTYMNRSYASSQTVPPASSFNFNSPAVATNVRANESTSSSAYETGLNFGAAPSASSRVPSYSTSTPRSTSTVPAIHNQQELPHPGPPPFQGSEEDQMSHGRQPRLHNFSPAKEEGDGNSDAESRT